MLLHAVNPAAYVARYFLGFRVWDVGSGYVKFYNTRLIQGFRIGIWASWERTFMIFSESMEARQDMQTSGERRSWL